MSMSFLDHSTRQLPTISVTWAPTPLRHYREEVLTHLDLIGQRPIALNFFRNTNPYFFVPR